MSCVPIHITWPHKLHFRIAITPIYACVGTVAPQPPPPPPKQNYIIIFTYLPLVDYFILQNQLEQLQSHVSASKCDIYWMQWCYKAIVDSACHFLSQIGSRGVPEPTHQARWLFECHFLAKMQRDSSFLPNILLKSILLCVSEHLEEKMKKVFLRLSCVRLDQIRLDQVRLGQVRLGQVRLGQVRLDQIRLDYVW